MVRPMDGVWASLVVEGPPWWQAVFWCGMVIYAVGLLWLVVCGFQEHIAYGILMVLFPIVVLLFVATNWDRARRPFVTSLVGLALILLPQRFAEDSASAAEAEQAEAAEEGYEVYGEPTAVYRYTDRFGRVHLAHSLDQVPEEYRSKARRIDQ